MTTNPSGNNQRRRYHQYIPFIFRQDRVILSAQEILLQIIFIVLTIAGICSMFAFVNCNLENIFAEELIKGQQFTNITEYTNTTAN